MTHEQLNFYGLCQELFQQMNYAKEVFCKRRMRVGPEFSVSVEVLVEPWSSDF